MQFYLSSLQYSFIAISYKLFPSQSITTITGKFSTSSFLIDSVPKSSYAITSLFFMHFDKRAPAPPIAAKYTALFLTIYFIFLSYLPQVLTAVL